MQIPETEIIVTQDGAEVLRKTVRPGDYVIGREPECEVRVELERVSGRHAQLTVNFDHVLIEDLGSASGTLVNGKVVTEPTRLWPNQKIQIGAATVELRRVKTIAPPDVSLAPSTAAVKRLLPEEFLHEKKYDIGGVVAQGGMGAILNAKEVNIERVVAMKVMLDGSSPDDLTRFVAEAKVTGQLEHPNIVPVHELGVDENDQVYYTMKFVKGITLRKVLEEMAAGNAETLKNYPLPMLLTIFQKVCDAIAFAHSKGVIHRDLKPENIMLGDFGEALVMDWGLAKVLGGHRAVGASASGIDGAMPSSTSPTSHADHGRAGAHPSEPASVTLAGTVMGTPQYMAPEQARGEVEELDGRADIYSLGAILYHLLALRPSVTGDDAWAMVAKVSEGTVEPLTASKHRPIPDSLAAVVRKAMAFERDARYAQVADLQRDIGAYQGGFATSAEHASAWKQFTLLIRRNKGIFTTAAAAWLLITALAVWFVVNLRAKERRAVAGEQSAIVSEAAAKAEAERATKAEAVAVQEKESTRHALAKSALALAEAARREGNGPEMQAALGEVPEDLRDSTWHYLLDQSDSSIARIRTADGINGVAADPRRPGVFAIAWSSGKVTLMEVRTGASLLEFKPVFPPKSGGAIKLAFSPDGERIAVGSQEGEGRIVIHSARDGKKLLEWEAPITLRLEFSPDGRLLLQVEKNSELLTVWDAATGQPRWKYESEGKQTVGTFTPDSQQVVTFGAKERGRLVNAQDGTLVRPLGNYQMNPIAVRPDGKMIVTGFGGRIKGVFLADGKVAFDFQAQAHSFAHLSFTPDGARFVSVATLPDGRKAIQLWDANTGAPLQSLLGGSGEFRDAGVHPLSGELLVAGASPRAWDLTGTPEKWTLRGGNSSIAFWGSDDVVFAAAPGQNAALQKLQAGAPELLWKTPNSAYRKPSVSADGRFAAVGYQSPYPDAHDLFLLRNPGDHTEQVAIFKQTGGLALLRLSPTGDRLAAITGRYNNGVALYDPTTGQQPVKLERKDMKKFWDLGWVNGGQQLVGLVLAKAERGNPGSEEWIVLWDAATGKVVQTATNRTAMDALAVAPDGRRFAEAGADKMVRIRDAATLAVQQEFRAHDGPITALAWHPTKPIVATASADLSVKIWNLETGRRLEELRGPVSAPTELAFSPSGQRLGCAGDGSPTRIWEPPSLNDQPAAAKPADGWEDLLAPLTRAAVMQTGNGWRLENGALFSPDKIFATLPLPGNLSGTSYQVRVKLRQLTAKDRFHLALPVSDRMVGFDLDGFPQNDFYTGLQQVKGKLAKDVPGALHGKQVKDSEQHDLEVTVRLDGANATITTTLDDQPLYEWTGPTADLSEYEKWAATPGTLALGARAADWVVYEVKVKRLEK